MTTLVIYDIPEDRLRGKLADVCLDYGLQRIQFSAFLGELSGNRAQEMLLRMRKLLGRKEGQVQCIPICEKDFRRRVILEPSKAQFRPRKRDQGTGPA
ncbi:MAG: CRISPR-associated endonuclease Cas2 [Armatimonadetes bacterium]|nr:CRISPR-associated endonuclease Cas2 [Armatimonadota bacterium]